MTAAAVTTVPGADGRKVVIDAGAVIKLQRLERLGSELFTTSNVVREMRDEKARALLNTLPLELQVKEPQSQDIAYTKQFAKATGDYGFLSQNDMELIALTVQLHRENGGPPLKEKPAALSHQEGTTHFDWAPGRADAIDCDASVAGSQGTTPFKPPNRRRKAAAMRAAAEAAWEDPPEEEEGAEPAMGSTAEAPNPQEDKKEESKEQEQEPEQAAEASVPQVADQGKEEESDLEPDEPLGDDDEDGSSAGEWVTPDNFQSFGVSVEADAMVKVTCATSDYSVQNVLLQMGITPLTFDGYAVRSVKMWGLYCRACYFFTKVTEKVFCPKCGHDTLVRVPIVVDQDGNATAVSNGRPLRRKGTVYSMPKPTTGRGWKPIFAEDEVKIGGRDREIRRLNNLADKEKTARDPFNDDNGSRGWWQRSTTSTGKMLTGAAPRVQAGYGRRNPNSNNFGGFKK